MNKTIIKITSALLILTMLAGCSAQEVKETTAEPSDTSETSVTTSETTTEATTVATTETTEEEIVYDCEPQIPDEYTKIYKGGEAGTVEQITYTAKAYVGDGEGGEKKAYVYLPAGYDPNGKYNVIYLMHGMDGSENSWGLNKPSCELKNILDNLIGNGDIEPLIVVTPNCRALGGKNRQDLEPYLKFGNELRNDLIPYIEKNYATYADYSKKGYDLTASREHRALAGLSMGGLQTINVGMCECMDLFSWFGAFSPADIRDADLANSKNTTKSEYKFDYFYLICGTYDKASMGMSETAAKEMPEICGEFIPNENFTFQKEPGAHDWPIWYLGIYNFAKIAFAK